MVSPVQRLPPSDETACGHVISVQQTAVMDLAAGDSSVDGDQNQPGGTWNSSRALGRELQSRLADQAQDHASDERVQTDQETQRFREVKAEISHYFIFMFMNQRALCAVDNSKRSFEV